MTLYNTQMKNEACANGRKDEAVWLKGYCPVDLTNPVSGKTV